MSLLLVFVGTPPASICVAALMQASWLLREMRKNVAGQVVCAQMNARADGAPITSGVSVLVLGDGGAQGAGGGTLAHEGNGAWSYAPTQAETNFAHVAFTFAHASGVNQTVQVYPVAYDPGDAAGLGLSRVDAAIGSRLAAASYTAPDNATIASIQSDTNDIQTRLPAALVGGRMDSSVGAMGADVITAAAIAPNAITASEAPALANLDVAVSTRSTYAGADTAGTTTLLGRLTAIRATLLDQLSLLDVAISSRLDAAGYTAPDNAGVGTLVGRLTAGRASNLDNLDALVSSRLPTAGYTAPDNVRVALIEKLLRNKLVTDPGTGVATLYDDDSVTPLLTAQLYETAAGGQTYRGQGAERRERLA